VELTVCTFLLLWEEQDPQRVSTSMGFEDILKALFGLTNITNTPSHVRRAGEHTTLIKTSAWEVTNDISQIK
jgi:hypothetical protein